MIKNSSFRYHSYDNKYLWASKNRDIYKIDVNDNKIIKSIEIKELSFISRSNLYNRLTRNGIHNIIPLKNSNVLILIKKNLLVYKDNELINKININRGSRPLRNAILEFNNKIIYGDYWSNKERKPTNIYQMNPLSGEQEILLTFNNIRHIHFIQKNISDEEELYIGTGDKDYESNIFKYNIKNKDLIKLGGGSQEWRAVSILQKENYIYWGSDCPYKKNYIFRYNKMTQKKEKIFAIEGPAYYSTMNKDEKLFIATTIENRKKHRAIIYQSDDGLIWNELVEFEKDIFPEKLFGYGLIEFIRGQEKLEDLYINTRGLKDN